MKHLLIQPGKHVSRSWRVAPIAHQITHNREHADKLHTCCLHAQVGCFGDQSRGGAACFDVRPDGIALRAEGECCECRAFLCALVGAISGSAGTGSGSILTDVRYNPSNHNLLPSTRFYGGSELGVVPGIDLALAFDDRGLWIHGEDFFRQWSVWS